MVVGMRQEPRSKRSTWQISSLRLPRVSEKICESYVQSSMGERPWRKTHCTPKKILRYVHTYRILSITSNTSCRPLILLPVVCLHGVSHFKK
jgi:hypothetical protein